MVVATALGWHDLPSILLSIVLAFVFGYGLTMRPLLAGGTPFRQAVGVALAGDTLSIVVMEIVDTAIVLAIPGAMDAGLTDPLFWGSLVVALAIAFAAAVPANYLLIGRGGGHADHGTHADHGEPH
jgi:hypothetical protein